MCCRQRIRRLCCPCAGVCVLGPAFPFCLLRASGQRAVRDWAPQVFPGLLLLQPQSSVRAFPSSLLQELSGGCFGIPGRGLFNCGCESEEVNPCTVTGAFPGTWDARPVVTVLWRVAFLRDAGRGCPSAGCCPSQRPRLCGSPGRQAGSEVQGRAPRVSPKPCSSGGCEP